MISKTLHLSAILSEHLGETSPARRRQVDPKNSLQTQTLLTYLASAPLSSRTITNPQPLHKPSLPIHPSISIIPDLTTTTTSTATTTITHLFSPVLFLRLHLSRRLKVQNTSGRTVPDPRRVKLPAVHFGDEAADVTLESRAAAPAQYGAADGAPGRDDDVDAAVDVWVFDLGLVLVLVCVVVWRRLEMRVLPDTEGFVERVEAVAAVVALSAERERRLSAVAGRGVQGQGVGDPAFSLEAADDVDDEVEGLCVVAVRQDHVHVAAVLLAAPVAADYDTLDVPGRAVVADPDRQDPSRVPQNHRVDGLDFGPGDLDQELVVVFDADLLHARQRVPAELDHVVEVLPAVLKVEFPRRVRAHAPDVPEETQHLQVLVGLQLLHALDVSFRILLRRVVPFVPEHGDLIVAAWQARQLLVVLDFVRVGRDAGDRRRVCAHADLVQGQQTGVFDLDELCDERRVGCLHHRRSAAGICSIRSRRPLWKGRHRVCSHLLHLGCRFSVEFWPL